MNIVNTIESTSVPIIENNTESTQKNQDPFKPSEPSLLITESIVNDTKTRLLIDTGAVLDYIDTDFCRKIGIITDTTTNVARMANKTVQELTVTKQPVEIQLKGYT